MALGKQLIVSQSPYIKYKLWEMIIQPHKYEAKKIKWVKKIVKLTKSGIKLENIEGQVFLFVCLFVLGFCENLQEK